MKACQTEICISILSIDVTINCILLAKIRAWNFKDRISIVKQKYLPYTLKVVYHTLSQISVAQQCTDLVSCSNNSQSTSTVDPQPLPTLPTKTVHVSAFWKQQSPNATTPQPC